MDKRWIFVGIIFFIISQAAAQPVDTRAGALLGVLALGIIAFLVGLGFFIIVCSEWVGAMVSLHKQRKKENISKKEVVIAMFLGAIVAYCILGLFFGGWILLQGMSASMGGLVIMFLIAGIFYVGTALGVILATMILLYLLETYLSKQLKNKRLQFTVAILLSSALIVLVVVVPGALVYVMMGGSIS